MRVGVRRRAIRPGPPQGERRPQLPLNWWFFSMAVGVAVAIAAVSYVQENVGWGVGFGVPFAVVSCASAVFLLGTPAYRLYAPPRPDTAMDWQAIVVVGGGCAWRAAAPASDMGGIACKQ
uniref:Uncharacterized protein n=1 Tax=Oryza barthii TaxID=65489 RepID=A0A0D3H2F0_9ORYZ